MKFLNVLKLVVTGITLLISFIDDLIKKDHNAENLPPQVNSNLAALVAKVDELYDKLNEFSEAKDHGIS